jgi:metal-sulfur cluster biosynthetic enzyme
MSQSVPAVDRNAVIEQLDRVTDPELDQSIVELDYIDNLRVDPSVFVQFKLPTAWCSPAFAWMMATDIRERVTELSGVENVTVRLIDHMHEEEITHGVNEELAFESVFEDATDGVEEVRAMLDEKARLARQYRAVEALLDAGVNPEQIVALTRTDVTFDEKTGQAAVTIVKGGLTIFVPRAPIADYIEKALETEVLSGEDDRLFMTPDGNPITSGAFERVHQRTRSAKTNMTGQGGICDALNRARYGSENENGLATERVE